MPTLGAYVTGWVVLLGLVAPLGWAAVEVRRWLLGTWCGAWARLVEAVVGATLVTLVAEALGTVVLLRRVPLGAAGLVVGVVGALGVRRLPRRPSQAPEPKPLDKWALGGGLLAVAGVGAQWLAWTAQALRQGVTAYDAVFYHGPIAARFAQTADLTRIHAIVPGEVVAFYPDTTELWHAIGIVAFRTDVLSPLLNLAALAIVILAAWCLGRSVGGGPAAIAGMAVVMAVPYVVASQPGSSFNDAFALAALLAAAVLLARTPDSRGAGIVAAVAAGMAVGMKFSFLAPAGLLTLAAAWLAPKGKRVATIVGWSAVILVTGGYWYVRNLVRIGNPLPGVNDGLPSPPLPLVQQYGARLLSSLDLSSHGWRTLYWPGLHDYFGRIWPAMLIVVIGGVVVGLLAWRASPWHAALAAVTAGAAAAYTVTPVTGDPAFFQFNLRYTLPIQGLAVLVLATAPRLSGKWVQRALVGLALVALVVDWPGPRHGASAFEIGGWPAGSTHRLAAVALVAAGVALTVAIWRLSLAVAARSGSPNRSPRPRGLARRLALVAVCGLAVIVAGRGVSDRLLAGRYQHLPGELGPSWTWAQSIHDARIGVAGLYQQYPYTGSDLSNFVQYVGEPEPHGGLGRAPSCRVWREDVNAGYYQYIVTSREGIYPPPGEPPEAGWTRADPSAHQVLKTGSTAVFKITGPMHPGVC